ncbi:hypothetical protein D3C73_618530 [compost metagenome]
MKKLVIIASFLLCGLLIQGCGQNEPTAGATGGGSFSDAAGKPVVVKTEVKAEQPELVAEEETPVNDLNKEDNNATKKAADAKPDITKEKPSETKEAQKPVEVKNNSKDESAKAKNIEPAVEKNSTGEQPVKEAVENTNSKQEVKKSATAKAPASIDWSGFFDGDDQTTPSEQFWDLSGSTVTIKGFMGEVLSFEKNWFLLIPEPGAECPFDNGDETYWNKIMIVFVPDDVKLRYTSKPLELSGRLDVGIKIDESGYKTMFRLYDASFKEVTE